MELDNIYQEIATRTGGDIYVGVVGPVRVGKSTFITKFMERFVIPNIQNANVRQRAIDELPQSADGLTVMTTQPKFVPNQAAKVSVAGNVQLNVRMVDCVGYMVDGANGHMEENKQRMVKTPWQKGAMPFEEAAEIGTRKVVSEHSTVAVLLTSDGSFTQIARKNYEVAERRLAEELKQYNKPFVVVLNTTSPKSQETMALVKELEGKYATKVLAVNVLEMDDKNVDAIFASMLSEFPLVGVEVRMPAYMQALDFASPIIQEVVAELKANCAQAVKIGDFNKGNILFESSDRFDPMALSKVDMGVGKVQYEIVPKEGLFYEVLSLQCGTSIKDDFELVNLMQGLAHAKREYDKLKDALTQVEETGYGVVMPTTNEIAFEEPYIVRQGSRYGVKLAATAPSLHIMRVDLNTEISPMVGTEQQSEDLVEYLKGEYNADPQRLWDSNMFGKSMHQLMNEGLASKLNAMPTEAQKKMRKTLTKIVNEGKGGIICILL